MKQNYKIYLCALLLVGAVNTMTIGALGADKPTLVVFVVGMDNTLGDKLATQIGSELNRNSRYTVATGEQAVQAKLTALRTQGAGSIDRNALAEWGRTNGISTICLVTDAIKGSDHMFYAHLIDAKESKVAGRGSYTRTGVVEGDLPRVSSALSQQLNGPERRRSVNVTPQQKWFEPEMVFVEGGTYQMGYNSSVDGTKGNAMMSPHNVTVNNFYIGKYEVTRAQWIAIMSGAKGRVGATATYTQDISNLGNWKDDDQLPMESVSWEDITGRTWDAGAEVDIPEVEGYLERLNALTGKSYRLPTDEEWEYAARGGKHQSPYKYSGSNDLSLVGWSSDVGSSGGRTHVVGSKLPNALGIYDMTGNVWEWCSNCWRNDYNSAEDCSKRGFRSGGFNSDDASGWLRVSARCNPSAVNYRNNGVGFRVVLPAQ
jgi:formylglycine-generating enzyme required for sulfatase activity